jgi:hypothetical protein
LAYVIAGPLADQVFVPLLLEGGALANTVGRVIGVGPGRGTGFMFIVIGALSVVVSAAGYLYPHVRNVEDELPDVMPEPDEPTEEVVPIEDVTPSEPAISQAD